MFSADGLERLGTLSKYSTAAFDINKLGQSVGSRSFDFSTTMPRRSPAPTAPTGST